MNIYGVPYNVLLILSAKVSQMNSIVECMEYVIWLSLSKHDIHYCSTCVEYYSKLKIYRQQNLYVTFTLILSLKWTTSSEKYQWLQLIINCCFKWNHDYPQWKTVWICTDWINAIENEEQNLRSVILILLYFYHQLWYVKQFIKYECGISIKSWRNKRFVNDCRIHFDTSLRVKAKFQVIPSNLESWASADC